MLTIYTDQISPRLSYVIEVLFEDLLSTSVILTQDRTQFGNGPSLNYSNEVIDGVPFVRPHSLLFENGIRKQNAEINSEGLLFPTDSDIFKQDVFAAVFYLVSRYEEYVDTDKDELGRAKAKNSVLFRAELLETPLVDQWALEMHTLLSTHYPSLAPLSRSFSVLPTFDIDVAYAYKGRGWWRKTRSWAKDLVTFKWKRIKERRAVLKGALPDPYDSYSYQRQICEQAGVRPRHFFLLGNYGKFDKNLSPRKKVMQDLILDINTWSTIGIHPSIGSHKSKSQLKKELKRLHKITRRDVVISRQHYLKFQLPETYNQLHELGIKEDYSMAYADHIGFRAGTASPYRWYDLKAEKSSALFLVPTAVMDSTLKDYMGLSLEDANERIRALRIEVEKVKGTFVVLWHNHSCAQDGEWAGWRKVLETGLLG